MPQLGQEGNGDRRFSNHRTLVVVQLTRYWLLISILWGFDARASLPRRESYRRGVGRRLHMGMDEQVLCEHRDRRQETNSVIRRWRSGSHLRLTQTNFRDACDAVHTTHKPQEIPALRRYRTRHGDSLLFVTLGLNLVPRNQ